jgi:hypothetical protein
MFLAASSDSTEFEFENPEISIESTLAVGRRNNFFMDTPVIAEPAPAGRPRVLAILGWVLVIGGISAIIGVGRSMLMTPNDEMREFRSDSPVFYSFILLCPLYVIICGLLVLGGKTASRWLVIPWLGYCGPGAFNTVPVFGGLLGIPFFAFAFYALFNPVSTGFFNDQKPLTSNEKRWPYKAWLTALLVGGVMLIVFAISAPFGSMYFSPYPHPPKDAKDVHFIDYVAWQSEIYLYRFDAPSETCSNFAVSLIKQHSVPQRQPELRVEHFTKVPIGARLPGWFDASSVKHGLLLTEGGSLASSYAVIDQDRKRLYYFHCQ